MNRSISFIIIAVIFTPMILFSQTATEAFRFSHGDPVGTARNLGTGNSMFAIGPDFSVISANPSGLGGYKKSEFLVTAGIGFNDFSTSLSQDSGDVSTGNYSNFTLPNIGFIIHSTPVGTGWSTSNWAIGLNRVSDYNKEIVFAGNTPGSITDSWRENAEGVHPDDLNGFEEGLAYSSGAIFDFEEDETYATDYQDASPYALFKQESTTLAGGKSELVLAYGAELDNKLLIGFSLGLPLVNYTETRTYREEDGGEDAIQYFNELEYNKSLNTTGYGFNAKLGVTLKPTDFLNIAFASHSPTRLSLADNFNTTLTYDFTDQNNNGGITSESPYGSFQYVLRTPWSASTGIGIIAGKAGFIGAHAKFTDYSSMKYKYSVRGNGNRFDQIEREVNQSIDENYGSALQVNLGGEVVLNKNYRLRGGVTLLQSAFNNDNSFDPSFHTGLGYRGEFFYVDLGYQLTKEDEGYLPYETVEATQPLVIIEQNKHRIAATVGFKF